MARATTALLNLSSVVGSIDKAMPSTGATQTTTTPFNTRNTQKHVHKIGNIFNGLFTSFFRIPNFIFACPPAMANEVETKDWDYHGLPPNIMVNLNKLTGSKKYKVANINFTNRLTRTTVNATTEESYGDLVTLKPGGVYTEQELVQQLKTLTSMQCFEKIELDAKTNPDGSVDINIPFKEIIYPPKTRFKCVNLGVKPEEIEFDPEAHMTFKEQAELQERLSQHNKTKLKNARGCVLSDEVGREIETMLSEGNGAITGGLLRRIGNKIMKWYQDNGYHVAQVVGHSRPESNGKEMVFEVVEGDITKLGIKFVDKLGYPCEGTTDIRLIQRFLPAEGFKVGSPYVRGAFDRFWKDLDSLDLFANINFDPNLDEKKGTIAPDIVLQEKPHKYAEVSTEWNIFPGQNGLPTLASIKPGATISFEHRNIKGLNRSLNGAITLSNLFDPEDDLSFKLEYTHPYLDGVNDPRNRTFQATCFNSRKQSPVFRSGPGVDDHRPIWVDRAGIKANITECYSRQSKFSYGLVMEDIRTRDEDGQIASRADKVSLIGVERGAGPPTTLSGTGVDQMAFLQANLTRDNTKFVNGTIVGARDVFQVDQGLGIGSKNAFFNRHKISSTRFIPLMKVKEEKGKKGPPVLVLHGLYGGTVGDLPSHEAFTIGGPHSVRGYDMGEIGASRNKLELAAEVRLPVKENAFVYAFAEHGNDLGSSVGVQGNPTKMYSRPGHGSSYGAGVKIGNLRAEYVVDYNDAGRGGGFFFHFGDRF